MHLVKQKKSAGFALVEVVVSIFIIASILVAVYSFVTVTVRASILNGERTQAFYLAAQQQEAAKLIGFNNLPESNAKYFSYDGASKDWDINAGQGNYRLDSQDTEFYFTTEIINVSKIVNGASQVVYKKVTTTICWRDSSLCYSSGENSRKITISTYIGE